ncbi:hypothetical protein CF15_01690 [Pyrodictium occultum]|uniref:Histidinol dehydrogenase n=1 Tax=Pyrodictium occultum TaxID=2309 RepID=A0A0V8RU41_PYROC|nr:histidinol dehydrogenase [Pyrodictium occultum]KSW11573.1 hypothetical protein CF15_01690 [Pyrodictium occultum]
MPRILYAEWPRGPGAEELEELLGRSYSLEEYVERVRPIVEDVRRRGYEAAREYSERFDGVGLEDPRLGREEMSQALDALPSRAVEALERAVEALRRYHSSTLPPEAGAPGARLRWHPVERVGVYAPGGLHPYPSTVVHTVVPARVAGCRRVVVASPPCRSGCGGSPVHPAVLAAAYLAGADAVYALGGAQAVAALAYGAEPVEKVDMVVGPGSPYVQAAKLLVSSVVGVDMIAGPTELAVVADESADPVQVALDMLAEAEHGPLSLSLLATPSRGLAEEVYRILRREAAGEIGGLAVAVTPGLGEALELVSRMAPEHLVAYLRDPGPLLEARPPAGLVSLGVPPALLDYAYGPSHVLPTGGAARWRGGLGVYTFLRPVAYAEPGLGEEYAEAAAELARLEGFTRHARSIEYYAGRLERGGGR